MTNLHRVLLTLDTASSAISVALATPLDSTAPGVSAERSATGRRHGELLAPAIAEVLAAGGVTPADLTCVAVGTGPGPFTGLRVGLVTARVLALTRNIPVLGVCSLDALAYEARSAGLTGRFRVVTDARRKEVYWAEYDGTRRLHGPVVSAPADAATELPAVGEGAELYPDFFPVRRGPSVVSAAAMARHVLDGLPTTEPLPLYLRRPDATPAAERKPVLA